MSEYSLTALGMVNALGTSLQEISERLFCSEPDWLAPHHLRTTRGIVPVGQVREPLPDLPSHLRQYQCRNHALAYMTFQQIEKDIVALKQRVDPQRLGVVMGSSTSGAETSESAFFKWRTEGLLPENYHFQTQHEMGALSEFIAKISGAKGPAYTVSTACSSSAKVFASAQAMLDLNVCDAVIVGGADTLCHLTLNGFEALAALSREVCNPMSRNRIGLNIGEGAALFILSREPGAIRLLGVGESSDAHHISAPAPDGRGAEAAMRHALAEAGLKPDAIHYINLHGTGTKHNDSMEAAAIHRIFGQVPVSSTKPLVGHCLGAAGAIEVGFCWLALERAEREGVPLPPHHWDGAVDESFPNLNLVRRGTYIQGDRPVYFLSNSFAFGGSNCSVLIGKNISAGPPSKIEQSVGTEGNIYVREWSAWAPGLPDQISWRQWLPQQYSLIDDGNTPSCAEVHPMIRRRCGRLVRMVLEVAFNVCKSSCVDPSRVHHIHCSRFGEINAMHQLFDSLRAQEPMSPTLFSNSVHQTPAAYFDLATGNTYLSRTISAGKRGIDCAMLEVWGLLRKFPETPVLLTFADEPLPEPYNISEEILPVPFAMAFLCESSPCCVEQTFKSSQKPVSDIRRTLAENDSPFDFLRWLAGSKAQFQTLSLFGKCVWHRKLSHQ